MRKLKNEYFNWLCDIIGIDDPPRDETYWILAKKLFSKEYYWTVDGDENRALDGKELRNDFLDELYNSREKEDELKGPCTILELLIALSFKIEENLMYISSVGDRSKYWFWVMIDNLGLSKYTDSSIDLKGNDQIDHILEIFMDRTYSRNGRGGLWPLKKAVKDQRKVEIWYQLNAFFEENLSNI